MTIFIKIYINFISICCFIEIHYVNIDTQYAYPALLWHTAKVRACNFNRNVCPANYQCNSTLSAEPVVQSYIKSLAAKGTVSTLAPIKPGQYANELVSLSN